jgi:hypothetical protein
MARLILCTLALLGACDGDREAAGTAVGTDAREEAYRLWQDLHAEYRGWPAAHPAPVPATEPHGAWIRVHYNDVAASAPGPGMWPEGTLILAENFAPDPAGPVTLEAIDVMLRRDDGWFWARFTPPVSDGGPPRLVQRTDIPIAGGELVGCASCHRQLARRDHVITEL